MIKRIPKAKPATFPTDGMHWRAVLKSSVIPGISLSTKSMRSERKQRIIERTAWVSVGTRSTIQLTTTMDPSKTVNGSLKKPPGSQCKPSATTRASNSSV